MSKELLAGMSVLLFAYTGISALMAMHAAHRHHKRDTIGFTCLTFALGVLTLVAKGMSQ